MSTAIAAPSNGLRQAELDALNGGPVFYTGSGREQTANGKGKFLLKGKKGLVAFVAVIVISITGLTFLGSSNSLLLGALEALFTESTDTQYAGVTMRSKFLIKKNLQGATINTWGGGKQYTRISAGFEKRLNNHHITVEGSGGNKTLVHTVKDMDGNDIITRVTANDFDDVFQNNLEFRADYVGAKRGRAGTFFDNAAEKFYSIRSLTRNIWNKFFSSGDNDADMDNFKDTMHDRMDGGSTDMHSRTNREIEETETDPETGEERTIIREDNIEGEATARPGANADAEVKASNFLDEISAGVNVVDMGTNITCALLKASNLINMIVAANEIMQSINYFMGLMENVSKTKAGDGDNAAANQFLNMLSTPQTSSIPDYNSSGESLGTLTQYGSPLEAQGMRKVLAYAPADASTTASYSNERITKKLGNDKAKIKACTAASLVSGVVALSLNIATQGLAGIFGGFLNKVKSALVVNVGLSTILKFAIPTIAKALFTNRFDDLVGIPVGEEFTKGASAANTSLARYGSGQSLSSEDASVKYAQVNNTVLAMDAELDRYTHSPFDITNKNTFFGSIAYSLLPVATSSKTTSLASLLRTTSSSLSSIISNVHATGTGSDYMVTFGDCPSLDSIGAVGDMYCIAITTTDVSTIELEPDDQEFVSVVSQDLECDSDGDCLPKEGSDLAKYIAYCSNRKTPFGILDANILSDFETSTGNGVLDTALNILPGTSDVIGILDGISTLSDEAQKWADGTMCVNNSETNPDWDTKIKYYQRYVEDARILAEVGAYDENIDTDTDTDSDSNENIDTDTDVNTNQEVSTYTPENILDYDYTTYVDYDIDLHGNSPVIAYQEIYDAEHPIEETPEGVLSYFTGMTKKDAKFALALIEYVEFIDDYDPTLRISMADGDTTVIKTGVEIAQEIKSSQKYHYEDSRLVQDSHEDAIIAKRIIYADVRNRNYTV